MARKAFGEHVHSTGMQLFT